MTEFFDKMSAQSEFLGRLCGWSLTGIFQALYSATALAATIGLTQAAYAQNAIEIIGMIGGATEAGQAVENRNLDLSQTAPIVGIGVLVNGGAGGAGSSGQVGAAGQEFGLVFDDATDGEAGTTGADGGEGGTVTGVSATLSGDMNMGQEALVFEGGVGGTAGANGAGGAGGGGETTEEFDLNFIAFRRGGGIGVNYTLGNGGHGGDGASFAPGTSAGSGGQVSDNVVDITGRVTSGAEGLRFSGGAGGAGSEGGAGGNGGLGTLGWTGLLSGWPSVFIAGGRDGADVSSRSLCLGDLTLCGDDGENGQDGPEVTRFESVNGSTDSADGGDGGDGGSGEQGEIGGGVIGNTVTISGRLESTPDVMSGAILMEGGAGGAGGNGGAGGDGANGRLHHRIPSGPDGGDGGDGADGLDAFVDSFPFINIPGSGGDGGDGGDGADGLDGGDGGDGGTGGVGGIGGTGGRGGDVTDNSVTVSGEVESIGALTTAILLRGGAGGVGGDGGNGGSAGSGASGRNGTLGGFGGDAGEGGDGGFGLCIDVPDPTNPPSFSSEICVGDGLDGDDGTEGVQGNGGDGGDGGDAGDAVRGSDGGAGGRGGDVVGNSIENGGLISGEQIGVSFEGGTGGLAGNAGQDGVLDLTPSRGGFRGSGPVNGAMGAPGAISTLIGDVAEAAEQGAGGDVIENTVRNYGRIEGGDLGIGFAGGAGSTTGEVRDNAVFNDVGGVITGDTGISFGAGTRNKVQNFGVIEGRGGAALSFVSGQNEVLMGTRSQTLGAVQGGTGDDTFTLQNNAVVTGTLAGDGEESSDTLILDFVRVLPTEALALGQLTPGDGQFTFRFQNYAYTSIETIDVSQIELSDFSGFIKDSDGNGIGNMLDNLTSLTPQLDAVLTEISENIEDKEAALKQLTPEIFDMGRVQQFRVLRSLASKSRGAGRQVTVDVTRGTTGSGPGGLKFWTDGELSYGRARYGGEIDQYFGASSKEFRLGFEAALAGSDSSFWGYIGYRDFQAQTEEGAAPASDLSAETTMAGFGLRHYFGQNLYIEGTLNTGMDRYTSTRRIGFGVVSETAIGDYKGTHLGASLRLGSDAEEVDQTSVSPQIGLDYVVVNTDAFTESGAGSLNLAMDAQKHESLDLVLGLDATRVFELNAGHSLSVEFGGALYINLYQSNRYSASLAELQGSAFDLTDNSDEPAFAELSVRFTHQPPNGVFKTFVDLSARSQPEHSNWGTAVSFGYQMSF